MVTVSELAVCEDVVGTFLEFDAIEAVCKGAINDVVIASQEKYSFI